MKYLINTGKVGLLILSSTFLLSLLSCKKEEVSRISKLTAHGWKQISEKVITPFSEEELFNKLAACEKDNLLYFKSNNSVEFREGATRCNPIDPDLIDSGVWFFNGNESAIEINIDGVTEKFDILNLEENSLVLEKIEYDSTISAFKTYVFMFVD